MERKWLVLSAVSVGTFMATLDGSIVNISLPDIQQRFGISIATVEWVVVAYLLTIGAVLLPFGRLGEVLTFRRVYLTGFAVFTISSILCGAAPSAEILVAFRVAQGVGAGMLMAMGPAIVARTFPAHERGRALGLNAISVSIGLSVGPALGGFLTEFGTWRAIFFVNAPVGLFAILWAARVLPAEEPSGRQRFDVRGAVLASAAVLAFLLALNQGEAWGWASPAIVVLLAAAVVGGVAFVLLELGTIQPLVDIALFRIRAFAAGNACAVFAFAGLFMATFLLPFLLEDALGYAPLEAGLLITPIPISMAVVAPFSGTISDRIGPRAPATLGLAVVAVGLLTMTQLPTDFGVLDLMWRLVLIGVGMGLFVSPNSSAVLGSVPRPRIGTASGVLAQARIDGQAFGIALSGAIVAIRTPIHAAALSAAGAGNVAHQALSMAIHDAFVVAAVVVAAGVLASAARGVNIARAMAAAERREEAA